MTFVVM